MTQTSHYALQKAIHAALTGNASLMVAVSGVFDYVPAGTAYPYLTLGESQVVDESTATEKILRQTVTVQAYGQGKGRKPLDTIMAQVQASLDNAALTVEGFALISLRHQGSEIRLSADGATYHGRVRFVALLQKTA